MKNFIYTLLFCVFTLSSAFAQIVIQDGDLQGGQTYTWTSDNTYMLDGTVFLETGGTLIIEAGTTIYGKEEPTTGDNASALVIAAGAQIFANGTANAPIIFTAEISQTIQLGPDDKGLWGGLIILGNANISDDACPQSIEGLPVGNPSSLYGNCDNPQDEESSGEIRFVSIRHGGAEIGAGNEINGLTLGGVGSETVIEFVEVYANVDDGIEFFGGTAQVKNASVSFCGDDAIDWDTGFRGKGQFFFILVDGGDKGGELDGAIPDDNTPFSQPQIFNATIVGNYNKTAIQMRDATGGTFGNSIFTRFNNGVEVEEEPTKPIDSYTRLQNGELTLENNLWWDFAAGNTLDAGAIIAVSSTATGDPNGDVLRQHLLDNGNAIADPDFKGISYTTDGGLDPRPSSSGPAFDAVGDYPSDDFFNEVTFKGAFGGGLWLRGWTALDEYGHLPQGSEIVIRDGDLEGGQTYNWTSDNTYILDGTVFLEEGGKLNIEAGTVIKGTEVPTTGDNASALVITRGARICAGGTKDQPIIFTAEADDVNDPDDLLPTDRGFWGGIIILGNANIADDACPQSIEGLPVGDDRSLYGNCDNPNDDDNSGFMRFVSIRHGGAEIGAGNEINGLTLGGVGRNTEFTSIEVIANLDDGIEFFGGTARVKKASVSFCGDDAIDWDTGFRGAIQYAFVLVDEDGDKGGELDGAIPDDNTPFSQPTVFNATIIGSGSGKAIQMRDATGGTFGNSIFSTFENGVEVEEEPSKPIDSYTRLQNGELTLQNNIWWDFSGGNSLDAGAIIAISSTATADTNGDVLRQHLLDNGNTVEDPELGGISYTTDGGLDPTPGNANVEMNVAAPPASGWFYPSGYKGAFCSGGAWIADWTALAEYGVLSSGIPYFDPEDGSSCVTNTEDLVLKSNGYTLSQNNPNPSNGMTSISFELPKTTTVNLTIYNTQGQVIKTILDNSEMSFGINTIEVSTASLQKGIYFYTLQNEEVTITKRMIVQ
ncbi:T9SS type A sorting domain-containing protein [Saprospiraceae bacterium]|nr:T9SS type A sorting domain-containing protein [Saprospiraceae bacterium]